MRSEQVRIQADTGNPLAKETTVLSGREASVETALSLKTLADETFILFGRPQGAITLQSNMVVSACQAALASVWSFLISHRD